jgi:hypothetical protein
MSTLSAFNLAISFRIFSSSAVCFFASVIAGSSFSVSKNAEMPPERMSLI